MANEEEADVVRKIFRTFLDTHLTSKIAKTMNEAGYTSKRANAFTKQAIHAIIKNDFYTGVNKYNGRVKGKYEAIISKHLSHEG